MAESTIHVVMLPWCAFGHLIPFFKLSIALAEAGVRVSFIISTPKNIRRLPKLPSTLNHLLDLVQFPLPSLDKELLPEGAEATTDIPLEKIQYLKLAYDLLQHAVKQFVTNQLPDWIICDFSPHWMPDIAQELKVKLIYYSVFSTCSMTTLGPIARKVPIPPESLLVPPEWVTFPSSVAFKRHEAIPFCAGANQINPSRISDLERLAKVLISSEAVLFRSCHEIEGEYLDAYQKLDGKPVIPIDQPLNARFLVDKGLAMEVTKNEDGSFIGNDIATTLRQAMVLEESKKLRINA
ncbi:hypothetical protein Fmac_010462 [Flemingia macrophylla]|uniref:Uncharacterized protein n=1 Tax=Flemingia macrophylla TaxID=520843 RepID=A0ABD1MJY0_9FABA